jgi:hypothetical protein
VPYAKEKREIELATGFIRLKFYIFFKMNLRKNRGLDNKMIYKIRSVATFLNQLKRPMIEDKSKIIFAKFLDGCQFREDFAAKIRKTWHDVHFIQIRLNRRKIIKEAKF